MKVSLQSIQPLHKEYEMFDRWSVRLIYQFKSGSVT